MYFQWSTEVELLFRGWKTPTWYFYLLSCFGVMLLAIMLEGIRLIIHNVTHSRRSYAASLPRRLADMLLYGLYVFIGYMVMLVVMTDGPCLAVVITTQDKLETKTTRHTRPMI